MNNLSPINKKVLKLLKKHNIDLPYHENKAVAMLASYSIIFLEGQRDELKSIIKGNNEHISKTQ